MKGHFVPEFFLRRFRARGGNLWVYIHGEGWKRRGSSDTAAEQDYYSPELEQAYHKIETSAANILDKTVYKHQPPTGERRKVLAYFLALLQLRTPTFYENLSKPLSEMMYMVNSMYHQFYSGNPEKFEEMKREMAQKGQPLPDWFKPEHLDPKPFQISPTKDLVFGTGLQAAETSAGIVNAMTWNFLTTSASSPFITSDNPFVYSNIDNGQHTGAGLGHPRTQVTVPLSLTVALVAELPKGHENVFLAVDETWVEQVNLRVMSGSDKFVVSSTQHFPGVQRLATMVRT